MVGEDNSNFKINMAATNYCQALIDANIEPMCEDLASGYEKTGVIINREDIDFATSVFSATDPNTLTALTLKSGKKGFKIVDVSLNPFTGSTNKIGRASCRERVSSPV